MSEKTADPKFLLKKAVEQKLGVEFPGRYISRYSMVVHSLIPYHLAKEAGKLQDHMLDELTKEIDKLEDLDLKKAEVLISSRIATLLPRER
jgi:kynurenine 3-monooxygenase